MSRPQHKDQEGVPIFDGRGHFTQKDLTGSRQYADHVKILETDDQGLAITKLPIGKHRLWDGIAYISLMKGDGTQFGLKHVDEDAEARRPEYDLAEIQGLKVHLRDGIKPDAYGMMVARVEINVRKVQPQRGDNSPAGQERHFLSINLFPTTEQPTACILIRRVRPDDKRLECLKHWGPDFNRSHVFVCPLFENLADHTKVKAEEQWLELVTQWDEIVKTRFEGGDLGEILDLGQIDVCVELEKEIRNIRNTFKNLFLVTLRLGFPLTDEQRLTAAKQWVELVETMVNSDESTWRGLLAGIDDPDIEDDLDDELHDALFELRQLFLKTGVDQATYDEAIKVVIP